MIEGTIIFKLANVGSKSEGVYPYLVSDSGEIFKIWKKGDISIDATALQPYDGKKVILTGEMSENDIFLINSVEENTK